MSKISMCDYFGYLPQLESTQKEMSTNQREANRDVKEEMMYIYFEKAYLWILSGLTVMNCGR